MFSWYKAFYEDKVSYIDICFVGGKVQTGESQAIAKVSE